MSKLQAHPKFECVKPELAWRLTGDPDWLKEAFAQSGRYDGQMVFRKGTAVPYRDHTRGIELPLLKDYHARGKILIWNAGLHELSYVYRYHDGMKHLIRAGKAVDKTRRRWEKMNRDFGDEKPLLPETDIIAWAKKKVCYFFCFLVDSVKIRYDKVRMSVLKKRFDSILGSSYMKAEEQQFWEKGDAEFYARMVKRHRSFWAWLRRYIHNNNIKNIVEVGGSYSPIPSLIPGGTYTNIDVNVSPEPKHKLSKFNFIEADFMDVDPESLPECDLLVAAAVVEHCPHHSVFFDWALRTKAKRIVVTFFNRLWPGGVDDIKKKGPLYYNRYSRSLLEGWLYERCLPHTIINLPADHVLEILPMKNLFDGRVALADEKNIQIRHDREQLRKLFDLIRSSKPSRMIEVGSFRGGTALVFAGALTGKREMLLVDLCDRKKAQPFLASAIKHLRKEGVKVTLFKGDSASEEAEAAAMEFGMVDDLYIDGSHKTRMVIHDYMTFRHFVKDGGIIGFHDVARPKLVKRAWAFMTQAWDKQGLEHYVIGGDEWDRKTRPWATGIGVLKWNRSALKDLESEAVLQELVDREDEAKRNKTDE